MQRLTTTIGLLTATVLTVALVPSSIAATTASWPDDEWVHDTVGTSSFDCGTDEGYATTASGRFLSGSLLGTNLDNVAALRGMTLTRDGAGALTVDPSNAQNLGSAPPTATYANPLDISLLGGIAGLNLTGLQVGLPVGSLGAVNQYAQVSGHGDSTGASGLVDDSGGVLVSASTPDDQLPQPATVSLTSLLGPVTGIADAQAQVGAVGASSSLDWCAALRSSLWGDGSVTGVTRDYGIAGLGVQLSSPLVGNLVSGVSAGLPAIQSAFDGLTGSNGVLSNRIRAQLNLLVPGLTVGNLTGNVTVSNLNLATTVSSLLTQKLTSPDGTVSVDLATGKIDADLAAILGGAGGLNDLPPNTQLVLNAAVLNPIITRVGALLDAFVTQVTTTITNAIRAATVSVNLAVGLNVAGIQLVSTGLHLNSTLGGLVDGTATFTVDPPQFVSGTLLGTLLGILGVGNTVASLTTAILGLATGLVAPLGNAVTTTVLGLVTTLGATLTGLVTPIVTAVGTIVNRLPQVLSLAVNVQPDQPGAPSGTTFIPASGDSSAQYLVTALRLGLVPFSGGTVAHAAFGTASAGPNTAP